jgi:hypothetical protein
MRSSASVAMGALPLTYNRAEAAPAKYQRHCVANAVGISGYVVYDAVTTASSEPIANAIVCSHGSGG